MTHDSVSLLHKLVISCLIFSVLRDSSLHYIIRVSSNTSLSFFPHKIARGYQQLQRQGKTNSTNVLTFMVIIELLNFKIKNNCLDFNIYVLALIEVHDALN